jgi:hypothetical protein
MSEEPATIDRGKLRAAIRRLGPEYVFYMLDETIDLLPPAELEEIAKKYIDLNGLRTDSNGQPRTTLLADVSAFDKASRAGQCYESFMVNSGNFTAQSTGTTAWIATCHRLLDRCVAEEKMMAPTEIRAAFDTLFGLLDYIDQGNDDVIFFADEGGAWQVDVDWAKVLPSWFRVMSATVTPAVVEDGDELDDEARARLHTAIRAGQAEMDRGEGIPAADVIARLRAA